MATLAELQAMETALEKALFSGIRSVSYDDGETTYRSEAEMRRALGTLKARIAAAEGSTAVQAVVIRGTKGV